ncbi:hypothetical protein NHH03_18030 [Stieleria sp. TO1_6]|uniref:hypothetical protein n=1 Tax=Stieleria tagensis TaxID=2956795 RepID=UPI00209AD8B2|nr:hypothetical protein [Stieleria tagensis]MCO8123650.1 hypothetical protein [Stieleria tagensis]
MRWCLILVALLLVIGAGVRLATLTLGRQASSSAAPDRSELLAQLRTVQQSQHGPQAVLDVSSQPWFATQGIRQLQRFVFDPEAAVYLGVGDDGAPGQAGLDDNANGIPDDPSEIGAVGSDDTCVSPADDHYLAVQQSSQSVVVSRGAWVASNAPSESARYRIPSLGWILP